jgi:hypothetical protein
MLLMNGRERTETEFAAILKAAGFAVSKTIRTRSPFWIIEALPA